MSDYEKSTQELTQPETFSADTDVDSDSGPAPWGSLVPLDTSNPMYFKFNKDVVTIGRLGHNDVVLPFPNISSEHAVLTRTFRGPGSQWHVMLKDTSRNGTIVDGHQINNQQETFLHSGNILTFAQKYKYAYSDFRHWQNENERKLLREYRLDSRPLGVGSFGAVYLAHHIIRDKYYAVKSIDESLGSSEEQRKSVEREIKIMQSLQHDNLCRLEDFFFNRDGSIDLVLEFVEGGDLFSKIKELGSLKEPMAIHITRQLCQGLSYMHSCGVAHRDLKPDNILLTLDDPPVVKIADFGLAKHANTQTRLKTNCGTRAYAAPEIFKNTTWYDDRVDSWSVGVTVFAMLTGRGSPFGTSTYYIVTVEDRIDWTDLELSAHAKDFVDRLLQPDPLKRMTFAQALEHPWLSSPAITEGYSTIIPFERSSGVWARTPTTDSPLFPSEGTSSWEIYQSYGIGEYFPSPMDSSLEDIQDIDAIASGSGDGSKSKKRKHSPLSPVQQETPHYGWHLPTSPLSSIADEYAIPSSSASRKRRKLSEAADTTASLAKRKMGKRETTETEHTRHPKAKNRETSRTPTRRSARLVRQTTR